MGTPPRGKAEPGEPAGGRPASRKRRAAKPARGTRTEAYPKTGLRPGKGEVGAWGSRKFWRLFKSISPTARPDLPTISWMEVPARLSNECGSYWSQRCERDAAPGARLRPDTQRLACSSLMGHGPSVHEHARIKVQTSSCHSTSQCLKSVSE